MHLSDAFLWLMLFFVPFNGTGLFVSSAKGLALMHLTFIAVERKKV